LVNFGRKPSLDEEFSLLEGDEEIERELEALKSSGRKKGEPKSEPKGTGEKPLE